jgi:hypothetical protein
MALAGADRAFRSAVKSAAKIEKTEATNRQLKKKVEAFFADLFTPETAERPHGPPPESPAPESPQEHKRATDASAPAAPPPPPAPAPAARAAAEAADSVQPASTTETVSATPPSSRAPPPPPPPPPPPGKVDPKGNSKPSPAGTNGPPPPPPPPPPPAPPGDASSPSSKPATTQSASLSEAIQEAAARRQGGNCTELPGGLTLCAYKTKKTETNKKESLVANETTSNLMAAIKGAASKPQKRNTPTAPKENAGPKSKAAQSGASLGANMIGLQAFLSNALGPRRKRIAGNKDDEAKEEGEEEDDDDSEWGDDDDETTSKQASFGQARRRFL